MDPVPLFQTGEFKLVSGPSLWKVECDALTTEDWKALAWLAYPLVRPFSEVVGVPSGGVPFADALRSYSTRGRVGPVLIADDVFTTGRSMDHVRTGLKSPKGIVAFARGPLPIWVEAIWNLHEKCRAR